MNLSKTNMFAYLCASFVALCSITNAATMASSGFGAIARGAIGAKKFRVEHATVSKNRRLPQYKSDGKLTGSAGLDLVYRFMATSFSMNLFAGLSFSGDFVRHDLTNNYGYGRGHRGYNNHCMTMNVPFAIGAVFGLMGSRGHIALRIVGNRHHIDTTNGLRVNFEKDAFWTPGASLEGAWYFTPCQSFVNAGVFTEVGVIGSKTLRTEGGRRASRFSPCCGGGGKASNGAAAFKKKADFYGRLGLTASVFA